MIKKIKLLNFRSHSKTEFELSNGVNIICGDNDLGKSSVLRGLNWLAFNKPSGDSFIKHGKKTCAVEITFDDISILRKKIKKGNNTYTILKDGNEINKFSAVGKSVPEEITQRIKIDEVNIQNQHDSAFLLSENSSYISKYLNNIVGLDLIDISLKNASSEVRRLNTDIKNKEGKLKEYEEDKKQYDSLEQQEELYNSLKENDSKYKDICEDEQELCECIDSIQELYKLKESFIDIQNSKELFKGTEEKYTEIKKVENSLEELSSLINDIKLLQDTSFYDMINIKKTFENLSRIYDEYETILETEYNLSNLINEHKKLKDDYEEIRVSLEKNRKEFKRKFPKECPLCGK